MINVALLSRWHVHADDYARQAEDNPEVKIKAVWDEDPVRGTDWAKVLKVPFEENLNTLLSRSDIDAVIITTPTNVHKEIILLAAKYRKHVFTEKVLAFTTQDCEEIYEVMEKNDINLMVSLPRLADDYYLFAQDVIDQQLLGKLTTIRCRLAHNGAVAILENATGWLPEHFFDKQECGGGALIDLGAHPIYLTNRLAGPAKALTARLQQTEGHEVDDNAVVLVEYESGALGVIETGFLSSNSPFQLELYGTEGTLLIENKQIRLNSNKLGNNWILPTTLPKPLPSPFDQWVEVITKDKQPTITRADVTNLTLINEVSILSHEQGRRINIEDVLKEGLK